MDEIINVSISVSRIAATSMWLKSKPWQPEFLKQLKPETLQGQKKDFLFSQLSTYAC